MARRRDVEVSVDVNRETAEHDISVAAPLQFPSLAEGEMKTEFIDDKAQLILFAFAAFDAHNFLKGNDIRVDRLQHVSDPVGADAPVQSTALMEVVVYD